MMTCMSDWVLDMKTLSLCVGLLQPDHEEVANLIIQRLQQMAMSGQEEGDAFHKLQTE